MTTFRVCIVGHSGNHGACIQLTDTRDCVDAMALLRVYRAGHSVNKVYTSVRPGLMNSKM